MDNPMTVLNTGARTHVNRATGGKSAPDVSLVHTSLVAGADWEVLTLLGSDHCPIRMTLDIAPVVMICLYSHIDSVVQLQFQEQYNSECQKNKYSVYK